MASLSNLSVFPSLSIAIETRTRTSHRSGLALLPFATLQIWMQEMDNIESAPYRGSLNVTDWTHYARGLPAVEAHGDASGLDHSPVAGSGSAQRCSTLLPDILDDAWFGASPRGSQTPKSTEVRRSSREADWIKTLELSSSWRLLLLRDRCALICSMPTRAYIAVVDR